MRYGMGAVREGGSRHSGTMGAVLEIKYVTTYEEYVASWAVDSRRAQVNACKRNDQLNNVSNPRAH